MLIGSWEEGFSLLRKKVSLRYRKSCPGQSSPVHRWGLLSMTRGLAESFSPAPLQCDCIWFGLLFLTFLLSLGWLYIVLILLNDLHNFNECVMAPTPPRSTFSPP